jgi:hypothetical protein
VCVCACVRARARACVRSFRAKGERQLKDIYEALRAGPGWENTLFVVQCKIPPVSEPPDTQVSLS